MPPGLGVGTRDHLLPFQCSAWLSWAPLALLKSPTAQQSLGEVQEMADSSLELPGRGTEDTDTEDTDTEDTGAAAVAASNAPVADPSRIRQVTAPGPHARASLPVIGISPSLRRNQERRFTATRDHRPGRAVGSIRENLNLWPASP